MDMFTKWPFVFPVPDQRAERIARLLCEEVVPVISVPEALLSDRGANLLSHLMDDVCKLLGIQKLNTTAYHPECDGMVERLIGHSRPCCGKGLASLGTSGMTTYQAFSGPTVTLLMMQLERSHHSYGLVGTAGHLPKLLCCHQKLLHLPASRTTVRNLF